MNTTQVAFIALAADIPFALGWDLIRRHMAGNGTAQHDAAQPLPAAAPRPPMAPVTLPVPGRLSARPADLAGRMTAFTGARAAGKTVPEAGAAAGVAERTARTYEARRLAALNGGTP